MNTNSYTESISRADVVELVDTSDLGSDACAWRFESFHPYHFFRENVWIVLSVSMKQFALMVEQ